MADIGSKEPLPNQWLLWEIAEDQRVGIFGDVPMSLDGLKRLQTLLNSTITQMAKGPVKP